MTRMYLSPTATTFVKIALFFVECLIGLFNLITYPIRKITIKAYVFMLLIAAGAYAANHYFNFGFQITLIQLLVLLVAFTIGILAIRLTHRYLNKKVSPRVAYLMNSPLGIPLNKYYYAG